jgi:hypothetical protein
LGAFRHSAMSSFIHLYRYLVCTSSFKMTNNTKLLPMIGRDCNFALVDTALDVKLRHLTHNIINIVFM